MPDEPFTIATDGDFIEQPWWPQWTKDWFPSYEAFWVPNIVPLTYRVKERSNIRFQTREELAAAGYSDEDVAVAQLHYSLLIHLGRVFELLDDARATETRTFMADRAFTRDAFFESFARLSGASDVSDELLARRANPGTYGAWDERDGMRARRQWRDENPADPLSPVRSYRNRLVHGRVVPEIRVPAANVPGHVVCYPVLGKVDAYLDWRVAFDVAENDETKFYEDFDEAALIVLDAWERVVRHVETAWQQHLL